jgi:hypothetical protein
VIEPRGTSYTCPLRVNVAVRPSVVWAAGRWASSAATWGRLANCWRTCRPASVGAPFKVNPEPRARSVQRWKEPKKNVRSRTSGPPRVAPNWFSFRSGASSSPAFSSRLLREFHSFWLRYQNADPWKALVPLFVTTFITEPAARPYSAANWFVRRRISWTMSVLLSGCWRPVTLGSLLSWPSIMKLLERARMPLVAKSGPEAKLACPLLVWLTPAAESARLKMSRWLPTGSGRPRVPGNNPRT